MIPAFFHFQHTWNRLFNIFLKSISGKIVQTMIAGLQNSVNIFIKRTISLKTSDIILIKLEFLKVTISEEASNLTPFILQE